jgi:hypothetical protein
MTIRFEVPYPLLLKETHTRRGAVWAWLGIRVLEGCFSPVRGADGAV